MPPPTPPHLHPHHCRCTTTTTEEFHGVHEKSEMVDGLGGGNQKGGDEA